MIKYNYAKDLNVIEKEEFYKDAEKSKRDYDIDKTCFEDLLYNKSSFELLLHFLPHYPYEIIKPIKISTEIGKYDTSCYAVWCEDFNKFGIGSTKEEAIEDFEHNVVTDYLLLEESNKNELTEDAITLLNIYRTYIRLR